jgi:hypothetical protein
MGMRIGLRHMNGLSCINGHPRSVGIVANEIE